jgi:hypothetical protein
MPKSKPEPRRPACSPRTAPRGPVEAVERPQAKRPDTELPQLHGHGTVSPLSSLHAGGAYKPPPISTPPSRKEPEGAREAVSVGICVHAERHSRDRRARRFMESFPRVEW